MMHLLSRDGSLKGQFGLYISGYLRFAVSFLETGSSSVCVYILQMFCKRRLERVPENANDFAVILKTQVEIERK